MNQNDLETTRINYVRFTNGLRDTYTDRHDGVPYTIPAGKTVNLPPDVAAHLFGFHHGANPADMMRYIAKRQGWNTSDFIKVDDDTGRSKMQDWFEKLTIEAVAYKLVPANDPDPREPIPADPEIPGAEASPRRGPGRPAKIAP